MKVKKPLATKFWKRTRGLGEVYRLHWLSARGLRRKDGAKQTALFIVPKLGSKVASVCSTPTPLLKFKELIPKMMGFKMYLRLQIWLFWGIHVSFRRCTHFNQFFLKITTRLCHKFIQVHSFMAERPFFCWFTSIHTPHKQSWPLGSYHLTNSLGLFAIEMCFLIELRSLRNWWLARFFQGSSQVWNRIYKPICNIQNYIISKCISI